MTPKPYVCPNGHPIPDVIEALCLHCSASVSYEPIARGLELLEAIYENPAVHRRLNQTQMPEDTAAQRVYKAMLALQVYFQEHEDEAAHDLLCDDVLDAFHTKYREELT